jgi:hypothetical protein
MLPSARSSRCAHSFKDCLWPGPAGSQAFLYLREEKRKLSIHVGYYTDGPLPASPRDGLKPEIFGQPLRLRMQPQRDAERMSSNTDRVDVKATPAYIAMRAQEFKIMTLSLRKRIAKLIASGAAVCWRIADLGRAPTRAELTGARRAAQSLAALGRASVLHVPGADADAITGDRGYLVLAKPN